jgi:predicted nuclease of predicted toxin-antitoxin system
MKFLVDNQLPLALAAHLRGLGHDCVHVLDLKFDEADDRRLWSFCAGEQRILISKDQDFVFLANQPLDGGRLLWVRVGNCRNRALLETFSRAHTAIVEAFNSGQRVVELM